MTFFVLNLLSGISDPEHETHQDDNLSSTGLLLPVTNKTIECKKCNKKNIMPLEVTAVFVTREEFAD